MALTVFAIIIAQPGAEADLRNGLYNLIPKVREEDACILYELYENAEHPERFIMYEIWTDEAGLQAHNQMPHMRAFGEEAKHWLAAPVELIKQETQPLS